MAVELYMCDPNGDLLLIMSRRVPSDSESENDEAPTVVQDVNQSASEENIVTSQSDGDNAETSDVASLEFKWESESDFTTVDCHFLVSSRHMILASSVFKAMLQGDFREGLTLRATGELELPLPEDDPDTFRILLDIIHGHNRKLPRQVDLLVMVKLTILVDKYQMLERVEIFSDMWIDGLQCRKNALPKYLNHEVLVWLAISWVFNKADPFRQVTQILAMEGGADMGGELLQLLPIPDRIISMEILQNLPINL
jgi:hypothetical protein